MMKLRIILVMCVLWSVVARAQVQDGSIEKLMTKKALTCPDIELNALSLIPHLYKENKTDTLDALLSYTARNCGMYEFIVTLNVLRDIKNGTFNEEINNLYAISPPPTHADNTAFYKKNIVSYLQSYAQGVGINNRKANYFNYTVVAYNDFYDLVHDIATSLQSKPGLTRVETFLVNFYANPDTAKLAQLKDSVYAGTGLHNAYTGMVKDGGVNFGVASGVWMPDGKLNNLNTHPFIGIELGGRTHRFMYDFAFDLRFVNAPHTHTTVHDDSLYTIKDYLGYYAGLDLGYAVFYKKEHEIDVLGGIAYEGADIWRNPAKNDDNNNNNNNNPDKTLNSLNLNAGLGYKFYLSNKITSDVVRRSYLALQGKYNFLNFKNPGGTDLSGNAFTITVIYGVYGRSVHHYYDAN